MAQGSEISMSFTPDGLMDRPIHEVVRYAARSMWRVVRLLQLGIPIDDPVTEKWCRTEDEINHACRVVLRLRARELVALCDRLGLTGAIESEVRRNPYMAAMAVNYRLYGGFEDED